MVDGGVGGGRVSFWGEKKGEKCVFYVVMIGICGKFFHYRGDSAQNFIFVFLFASLLNFKWT